MATVFHQIQYWTWNLAPGQSLWLSYGPDDRYKNGTVQVMCSPSTEVGDTYAHATQTLSVPEVFNTVVPTVHGDIVDKSAYAGFNIWNRGNKTVKHFAVALTVIGP